MTSSLDHITVCVCTFRRPVPLAHLLRALERQVTGGLFTYSILIVDNDVGESARPLAAAFRARSSVSLEYEVEPEQNIALARNKAVRHATSTLLAMIDDDEYPVNDWLLTLYKALRNFACDGILGPVLPAYECRPPKWVLKGRFYERPTHDTGSVLDWTNTRTGNALLRREIFNQDTNLFRTCFGMGGEDRDFFRRVIAQGFSFVWCSEAPVYEAVPAVRCKRSFMVRRAILRGTIPHFSRFDMLKSLLAVPLYTSALPLLLLLGHHRFMKYLIKDCDHIGRLLAFCGVTVIKQRYVFD